MTEPAIRDAATVILLRNRDSDPSVLMGQRGAFAAFMPGKFVFPGGALDASDAEVPVHPLSELDQSRLTENSHAQPAAIAAAAVRELWEETGQALGHRGPFLRPPDPWRSFADAGLIPNCAALQFFFRAVTPAGRPRRFDARFFLADASALVTDPDDFSKAEDELSHLQWVPLSRARNYDLPFITQVVLAELVRHIARGGPLSSVPYFRNDDEAHLVSRLQGRSPL